MERRRAPLATPAGVLLACCACSTLPSEPRSAVELRYPWGMAGAGTEEEARELARLVEEVLPVYRDVEGFVERPIRIHLTAEPLPREEFTGMAVSSPEPRWIAVDPASGDLLRTVAHELAHFSFRDALQRLPIVLEEGMCEQLADLVSPDENLHWKLALAAVAYLESFTVVVEGRNAKRRLAYLLLEVPPLEEALALDWRARLVSERRDLQGHIGLGTALAGVIGHDGVLALVERSEREGLDAVPVPWILAAADLDPPTEDALAAAFARAAGLELPPPGETVTITLGE